MKLNFRIILILITLATANVFAVNETLADEFNTQKNQEIDLAYNELLDVLNTLGSNSSDDTQILLLRAQTNQKLGKILIEKNRLFPDDHITKLAKDYLKQSNAIYRKIFEQSRKQFQKEVSRLGLTRARKNDSANKLLQRKIISEISIGWNNYFLAQLETHNKTKKHLLKQSQKTFMNFLDKEFTFNKTSMNSYLGYCMCLYEQEDLKKLAELLDSEIITPLNTELDYFKQVTVLRSKTFTKMNSFMKVHEFIELYFDIYPEEKKYDSVDLELALKDVECLAELATENQNNDYYDFYRERLNSRAHHILAYGGKWAEATQNILNGYNYELPAINLFKSVKAFNDKDYNSALALSSKGIADSTDKSDAIYCELLFMRTASLFKLNNYEKIFETREEIFTITKQSEHLPENIKLTLESFIQHIQNNHPLDCDLLIDYIRKINKISTEKIDTQDMMCYRLKAYLAAGRYRKAAIDIDRQNKNETGGSPETAYLYAYAKYKLAEEAFNTLDAKEYLTAALSNLKLAQKKNADSHCDLANKIQTLYPAVLRGFLLLEIPDCDKIADELQSPNTNIDEESLAALKLLIAIERKSPTQTQALAETIMQNEYTNYFCIDSLIKASEYFENRIDSETDSHIPTVSSDLYRYLIENWNCNQNNLDILKFKLAKSVATQNSQEAKLLFEDLSGTGIARSEEYLKIFGNLLMESREFQRSAICWRKLARIAQKHSQDWFLANYNLIQCRHLNGEAEQAKMLKKYFLAKHGQSLDEDWKNKFEELSF